jgi:hypothetical protein
VITDDTYEIVYNLPQHDILALRVVARFAYAVANPGIEKRDRRHRLSVRSAQRGA